MNLFSEARVWAVLILLTAANRLLMKLGFWHNPTDHRILGTGILALAFVKARLIIRYFMEVREAPALLGWILDAWVLAVFVSLSAHQWIAFA